MAYRGRVAIVTGGASGIGLGITAHLVKQGARVVIGDLATSAGPAVVDKLNNGQDEPVAAFFPTDVTSWTSQASLFAHAHATFGGRIDLVFANAGIAQMREMRSSCPSMFACAFVPDLATLHDNPPDLKVVEVNLNGVLYSVYLALAYFRAQPLDADGWRGKIVATGSNASIYPFSNDTLYAATKTGVFGMVRAVGPRVLKEGITVNCFGPSIVHTGLASSEFFDRMGQAGLLTPMQTILDACDMFTRPESRLTGHIIENCLDRNVIRSRPQWINPAARRAMDEFWSNDEIDEALAVDPRLDIH